MQHMTFLTKKRGNKGFTLIELLVVIAIIGILASIVLASLNTARKKSRDTRRVADINQTRLALELFFDSNRVYPAATTDLVPTFIASAPNDPISGTAYLYDALITTPGTTGNSTCTSTAGGTCQYFHIGAAVEDRTITAMNTDSDRCPTAAGVCLPANGTSTVLAETAVHGTDGLSIGSDCTLTAVAGRGCYDITP
jgi:prepilin-type N-terminal cleavage/methylation domain-containing protein